MGVKIGNKIDYTGDDHMDNGGFTPMGFGRIPSQQVKIDEKNELANLLKNYRTATLIILGLLVLIYASMNLALGRNDWYEVVNILEVATGIVIFFLLSRTLSNRYDGMYVLGDESRVYLNTNTIIAFVVTVIGFVYIHINTTDFLVSVFRFPEEQGFLTILKSVARTFIIFLTIAAFAPSVAMAIRLILFEILDRYRSAIEVKTNQDKLALEWAKFDEGNERYWSGAVISNETQKLLPPTSSELFGRALVVSSPDKSKPQPADDMLYAIVTEFLEGIDSDKWGFEERSWKGKRLKRSGYDLTAIGDRIRELLIRAGWAEWNHPEKKNLGWRLKYTPDEIKKGMLISGRNLSLNSADPETSVGDSETLTGAL